jgi:hypothetical protein
MKVLRGIPMGPVRLTRQLAVPVAALTGLVLSACGSSSSPSAASSPSPVVSPGDWLRLCAGFGILTVRPETHSLGG